MPSIIHAVDGVVLQLVCESIRADDSAAAGMLKKHEWMRGEKAAASLPGLMMSTYLGAGGEKKMQALFNTHIQTR